ncbi:MAG: FKBP-type peptidyl-prolyl cis-trans isomerase [Opitutaceae bacterium]
MNLPRSLSRAAFLFAIAATAAAQEAGASAPAPAQSAAPAPQAAPYTDAQLTELYGWVLAKQKGLGEFDFTPQEADGLVKGFAAAVRHGDAPYDLQRAGPLMEALLEKIQGSYISGLKAKNEKANAAFFSQLKRNPNVKETPSGLCYEILKPGEGAYPKPTDTVRVNYEGKLLDGTVFDSSYQRGQPAEFPLNGVIAGWTEGIQKINAGGKIRLYVPPALAYGDDGRPGIPPAATLIFDVELLDIAPTAAPPATAKP